MKSDEKPRFRLKIKNFERSLKPVQGEVERIVFYAPIAAMPYVRSFTDLGFKL